MAIQIENQNIVIIARSFNPTIFSQLWLVREGIIGENDFIQPTVFSPFAVDVRTKQFQLLVVPDRIQLTFSQIVTDKPIIINDILSKIITKLPHTPYAAIGFNNRVLFIPEDQTHYVEKLKKTLISSFNPLLPHFSSDDSRFGFYCSKDFQGMRLRLDIKPNRRIEQPENISESLAFDFNFHYDLCEENRVDELGRFLEKWPQSETHSNEIVTHFSLTWGTEK